MRKKRSIPAITTVIGVAAVGTMLLAGPANATGNPFMLKDIDSGYQQLANHGKCGAGKCGGSSGVEGKCGAGKCGSNMGGKCGVGKCGGTVKPEKQVDETKTGKPADN